MKLSRYTCRWLVVFTVLVGVALVREGAFGETASLELDWFRSWNNATTHSSLNSREVGAASFADRLVFCEVSCDPAGRVCDAVLELVHGAQGPATADSVHCTIAIDTGPAPFCYTPLFKRSSISASFEGTFRVRDTEGEQEMQLRGAAAIKSSAVGILSCLNFRRLVGREAAQAILREVNGAIAAN